jgi:WD40 repeat protein
VAFSPDGRVLASCSKDTTARLYEVDARGARLRAVLAGHTGPLNHVAFGWGGERLATASEDGSARVWTAQGELVAVLGGHAGAVQQVVFGAGDRGGGAREGTLITAGADGTLRLFPLFETRDLIERAEARSPRAGLSAAERAEFFLSPMISERDGDGR